MSTSRTAPRSTWRSVSARRVLSRGDRPMLAFLVVLTLASAALMYSFASVTAAVLMVPLLLTDLVLPPRRIPGFVGFLVAVLLVETALEYGGGIPSQRWVAVLVVGVMSLVVVVAGWRRTRLGVGGLATESMLLDLQGRINRQGELPALPSGWRIAAATRYAGGTSFAGDFMVAQRAGEADPFSLVLVDVSGKGVEAGTRSLLLSGALGALLGAAPAPTFLQAANQFLFRQEWGEGFATAVHLQVELGTGEFEVRSAGHLPVIHFHAGSGRWELLEEPSGPALGLVRDAAYPATSGSLGPGDALFLYTDGLVERRRRDIGLGIDRLIGEGERLVQSGFRDAADVLVQKLGAADDDCALVMLHRA